jgi:L-amino acid N-acyltransferase YncA
VATLIRDAVEADMAQIQAIYAWHVLNGLASFEETPPDEAEITRRWRDVLARGLPYFVAEIDSEVIGYAYAAPYRTRSAYRFTVEDSVYVDRRAYGRGAGRALLAELIARCESLGLKQMIAVIGDSANAASIGVHAAMGFVRAGALNAVGFKHGRWVDSVIMQRALGEGAGKR